MSFPRQSPSPQIPPNQQILGAPLHLARTFAPEATRRSWGRPAAGRTPLLLWPKPSGSSDSSSNLVLAARARAGALKERQGQSQVLWLRSSSPARATALGPKWALSYPRVPPTRQGETVTDLLRGTHFGGRTGEISRCLFEAGSTTLASPKSHRLEDCNH